ncbi:MAG: hypothetical protein OEX77_01300 [Candidatus Bathyarchaeota archaeon]|nr:hypothetical protein [Candidatus Bathyarchaeota archaeon]
MINHHHTKNIIHFRQSLGHRSISRPMIYTHSTKLAKNICTGYKNIEEACELAEAGFDYSTKADEVQIFGNRK